MNTTFVKGSSVDSFTDTSSQDGNTTVVLDKPSVLTEKTNNKTFEAEPKRKSGTKRRHDDAVASDIPEIGSTMKQRPRKKNYFSHNL